MEVDPSATEPVNNARISLPSCKRTARIVLVENDEETANAVIDELKKSSYHVIHTRTVGRGLAEAMQCRVDLFIADVGTCGHQGFPAICTLRQESPSILLIATSSMSDLTERIRALELGADDYLAKPYAIAELLARSEALLRRPYKARRTNLRYGCLEVDRIDRTAYCMGKTIPLSNTEFMLLSYLIRYPEQVFTRDTILTHVWTAAARPHQTVVDAHISQLRRKIHPLAGKPIILNVRGVGFMLHDLQPPADQPR
jgi:two-component system, OmpR family, response regulator